MKSRGNKGKDEAPRSRAYMFEARQDLEESKQTIRELLLRRQSLYKGTGASAKEVEDLKEKAIEAINHLFEDEVDSAE